MRGNGDGEGGRRGRGGRERERHDEGRVQKEGPTTKIAQKHDERSVGVFDSTLIKNKIEFEKHSEH